MNSTPSDVPLWLKDLIEIHNWKYNNLPRENWDEFEIWLNMRIRDPEYTERYVFMEQPLYTQHDY